MFLYRLGQAWEFQVGVGESWSVEAVFEPGASGAALGVEPVAFELLHSVFEVRADLGAAGVLRRGVGQGIR